MLCHIFGLFNHFVYIKIFFSITNAPLLYQLQMIPSTDFVVICRQLYVHICPKEKHKFADTKKALVALR